MGGRRRRKTSSCGHIYFGISAGNSAKLRRFLTFEQIETFPPDDDSFEENDDNDTVEREAQHQMLGYPVYIQDEDMAPGKVLLLQLDTDDDTGWMWGDMGMIYFWIAPQELDARNFDDVRLILECY